MADPARPKLSIPRTRGELVLELVGVGVLVALLVFALRAWPTLPQIVPVHFGVDGKPDAWGHRDSLTILLAIPFAAYAALSVLQRFPHIYNYPVEVTAENARGLYLRGRRLVLAVKVILTVAFAALVCAIVMIARGQLSSLSVWFLPVVVGSLALVLTIAILRMRRASASSDAALG